MVLTVRSTVIRELEQMRIVEILMPGDTYKNYQCKTGYIFDVCKYSNFKSMIFVAKLKYRVQYTLVLYSQLLLLCVTFMCLLLWWLQPILQRKSWKGDC